MKKLFAIIFFCLPVWAMAATPIQLRFDRASVQAFLSTLYGNILQKSFVLSPDVLALNRAVTLNVSLEPEMIGPFIAGFLSDQGLAAVDRDGVVYLTMRPAAQASTTTSFGLDRPIAGSLPAPMSMPYPLTRSDIASVTAEPEPPSYRLYSPSKILPLGICEGVNKVFPASCNPTGAVAVLVHPKHIELVLALAQALDARASLVDVSVTFVEVTGSVRDGFGLSLLAKVLGSSVGVNLGAASDSSVLSVKGSSFTLLLDVLRTDSRFKQVANPSGRVVSGQPFSIAIGDEVPTLAGQSRDQTGQVTSQVVYRPSGVLLNVLPQVVTDNGASLVFVAVDAQVSSFSKTESGVNGTPTLSRRQVKTSLKLADGEVAVIGGLSSTRDANLKNSLWGAPLGHREDMQSTDLVLMLSARVVP